MNYFDQFLLEIQTLKIAETTFYVKDNIIYDLDDIDPELHPDLTLPFQKRKYLDLRHYDQHRSNHEAELLKLQQLAINEVLNLSPAQIQLHLKRIEQILHRFDKVWEVFKKTDCMRFINKSGYPTIDLELKVLCFFLYDKFDTALSHSIWFFADLQDALMFKDSILEGFVSQVKRVLNIKEEAENVQPQPNGTEDLAALLNDQDKTNYEKLLKGFQGLETYINKNVFEKVGADLPELKKLNRELLAWKYQIRSVYVEPVNGETEFYISDHLNERKKQAITSIENKIAGALEVLQLRVNASQIINTIEPETTQSQQIKAMLLQYGFAEFLNTKNLNPAKNEKLLTLIASNQLPYRIALVKELGYVDYVTKEYCQSKEEMYNLIAKIFTASPRRVKGNILVLDPYSKERRDTYTSHDYKEQVTTDIKGL